MSLHPGLTRAGIDLVKRFEGLRRTAARLPSGGWTIGYGHTQSARRGAEVSEEQAEALLIYDLDKVARALDTLIFAPLTPNQFSAMVAFAFNIGLENFRTSAVLKRLNEGRHLQAALALELWRKADFQGERLVIDGLVRRRAAEKALFLTSVDGLRPVPTPVVPALFDEAAAELSAQEPGLADAAIARVPLEGGRAKVRMVEPRIRPAREPNREDVPGAATTEAVNNVTARLQALIPDEVPPVGAGDDSIASTPELPAEAGPPVEAEPAPPEAEAPAEPPPLAEPQPEIEPEIEAEAQPEPELQAEPEPQAEPDIVPEPNVPPEPEPLEAEAAAPPAAEPEPAFAPEEERQDEPEAPPPEPFGRRSTPFMAEPAETVFAPETGRSAPQPLQLPVAMLVGAFGVVAFIGALIAMIYGRATLANLAIGLLGVICMVPAGLKLLLKVFGERPPEA